MTSKELVTIFDRGRYGVERVMKDFQKPLWKLLGFKSFKHCMKHIKPNFIR